MRPLRSSFFTRNPNRQGHDPVQPAVTQKHFFSRIVRLESHGNDYSGGILFSLRSVLYRSQLHLLHGPVRRSTRRPLPCLARSSRWRGSHVVRQVLAFAAKAPEALGSTPCRPSRGHFHRSDRIFLRSRIPHCYLRGPWQRPDLQSRTHYHNGLVGFSDILLFHVSGICPDIGVKPARTEIWVGGPFRIQITI